MPLFLFYSSAVPVPCLKAVKRTGLHFLGDLLATSPQIATAYLYFVRGGDSGSSSVLEAWKAGSQGDGLPEPLDTIRVERACSARWGVGRTDMGQNRLLGRGCKCDDARRSLGPEVK